MQDNKQLQNWCEITSMKLGLNQFSVEKDYYVTKAIHALVLVNNDYYELIFQGGTSLSKGYRLIERFSEDIDFRVRMKKLAQQLGKNARRNKLR